ncbi:MAG: lipid-A-disaccharide synthase [Desulfotignum sp.]|jgi:lipid-A-disaccharide synthase|nr:lipid-A-disaccharide synthase [Desulfotignum sp.]
MNRPNGHIMVLTGEPSGDVHGASLVRAMQQQDAALTFSGIGGPCMAEAGVDLFFSIENLSAMGLTEVLFQIRSIKKAFDSFTAHLMATRPGLLILIDYPGFNLRAARFAKNRTRTRVFYYITPKIWAWNRSRIRQIKRFVDHAGLIFPFEEKIYKKANIPATYVGNPLMDQYPHAVTPRAEKTAGPSDPWIIGLLPGSRKAEIHHLLDLMLTAAQMIRKYQPHTRFLVSAAGSIPLESIKKKMAFHEASGQFEIISGSPGQIFAQADMLIAASGTVTLEAALCQIPTVIIYKMSPVTFRIARVLVKVKYAGLANIIAGRQVMPELLQADASPANICVTALDMLDHLAEYRKKLTPVRLLLGSAGAAGRAAKIALDLLDAAESGSLANRYLTNSTKPY